MISYLTNKAIFDSAVTSIGTATTIEDINSSYNLAVMQYALMVSDEHNFMHISENEFNNLIGKVTNYNIVRVATLYAESMEHSDELKNKIQCCINSIRGNVECSTEKELLSNLFNDLS